MLVVAPFQLKTATRGPRAARLGHLSASTALGTLDSQAEGCTGWERNHPGECLGVKVTTATPTSTPRFPSPCILSTGAVVLPGDRWLAVRAWSCRMVPRPPQQSPRICTRTSEPIPLLCGISALGSCCAQKEAPRRALFFLYFGGNFLACARSLDS